MNYLIFDNDVYYDIEGKTGVAAKDEIQAVLKGCNDDPNNQIVDENYTENDTETETGNQTDEVVGSSNEMIDPETTY